MISFTIIRIKETVSRYICSFKYIPAVLVDETTCCSEDWALEQDGSPGTPLLSAECCLSVEIPSRTQNQNRQQLDILMKFGTDMRLHVVHTTMI